MVELHCEKDSPGWMDGWMKNSLMNCLLKLKINRAASIKWSAIHLSQNLRLFSFTVVNAVITSL